MCVFNFFFSIGVKNLPAKGSYAEDLRDTDLIPGSGKSSGGGHGNPLWYSCLENPMDRGAWQATDHRVAKSWTRLWGLSGHSRLANNVVIVSGGQQGDSAIHVHESALPQTPVPARLPRNFEQSSLCSAMGPWLSNLNTAECTCASPNPQPSLTPILRPSSHKFQTLDFSLPLCLGELCVFER